MIRACLHTVVQYGLEGIKVEKLYEKLSYDDVWGKNFAEEFYQDKVWKYLLKSRHVIVFSATEEITQETTLFEKPQHIIDDTKAGLKGYCRGYEERKDITDVVSRDYKDAVAQYPILYMVARQGLREDEFVRDTNVILVSDINVAQYAMYENLKRVGYYGTNVKELTEAFNAKHSAIAFYGEFLESLVAFKVLFIAKKKVGKSNPYFLRCQYMWYRDHHGTIKQMVEVMNNLLNLVYVGDYLNQSQLQDVFNTAAEGLNLIESRHDTFELVRHYLMKLGVLVQSSEEDETVYKVKFTCVFELEYKEMGDDTTEEEKIADYTKVLIKGEPLIYQVYRMIDSIGKDGIPCHVVAANLGISVLLARSCIKSLISDRLIVKKQVTSAKTNMFVYVSLKFANPTKNSAKISLDEEGDAKHIPSTIRRLECALSIFEKEKYLTRPELVRLLKLENAKVEGMPDLDSKTVTRVLTTLINKGKIMKLTIMSSNPSNHPSTDTSNEPSNDTDKPSTDTDKSSNTIDMYHVPELDDEELKSKVEYLKAKMDNLSSNGHPTKKASHSFIGSVGCNLPDPIPAEMEGKGDFVSDGMYLGPRAAFLRQLYFLLVVLLRPMPVPDVIHEHYSEFGDWWQYISKLPRIEPLECGGYEIIKLINRFPIYFFIQCFLRSKGVKGLEPIMEHNKYRYYCVGQLPTQTRASLSINIIHGTACLAKSCELLEMMSLLEFTLTPDYTKKSVVGFRIKLRDQTLLLNTINAPVNPNNFKGYSINKMNTKDLIIVRNLVEFDDIVTYWEVAKNICFKSRALNKRSFSQKSFIPEGLENVLKRAGIPFDQPQQMYSSKGTLERLGNIRSHLGPAGYNLALMLHIRSAWVMKVDMERREKFGILVPVLKANVQRLVGINRNKKREYSGEEEEESEEEYRHEPTVKKIKLAKKIERLAVKRKLDKMCNKKRKLKHFDECDEKTRSMKTRERVTFTNAEDDVIMHCYICNLVLGKKSHDFSQIRDMLHSRLPKDSCDKTKDSCRRRLAVLLGKTEFKRKAMQLQSKLHMYMHIHLPNAKEIDDLFEVIDDSSTASLSLRIVLPTTKAEFESMFNKVIPDQDSSQTVLSLFLPLSYRIKRVQKIPVKSVECLWSREDIPLIEQLVYQLIQVTVSAEREYQGQYSQEVSFKVFQEVDKATVDQVYQYMLDKMLIKRYKKRKEVGGAVTSERVMFSSQMTQCYYNPFPNSMITDFDISEPFQPSCMLYNFKYSDISSSTILRAIYLMMNERVRTVIQAAINPYISPEEESQLLSNAAQETAIFSKYHQKDSMFVSGISSKEHAAQLGLTTYNSQIFGFVPHSTSAASSISTGDEKSEVVGYEELIGYNESYKVLPLNISFDVSSLNHSFWSTVDLDTGIMSHQEDIKDIVSHPTELTSNQLRLQSSHALNLLNGEDGQIALLQHYCKDLLGGSEELGKIVLEQVFQGKEEGILLSKLKETVQTNTPQQLSDILQLCLNLELVVYGGLQDTQVIGKHYAKKWHIALDSALPSLIKEDEKETVSVMEDRFEKMFPLTLKPWRLINGDFNVEFVRKLVNSIMLLVYSYPGLTKQTIDDNYHTFLSYTSVTEILNCMLAGDILERCFDKPEPPTLFSSTLPRLIFSQDLNENSCFRVTPNAFLNIKHFI